MTREASIDRAATSGSRDLDMMRLGAASFLSAGAGYVVLFLAARSLSPNDNADFLTFWAFSFMWFGILTGIYTEATRATYRSSKSPEAAGRPLVLVVAVLCGVSLGLILAVTSPIWSRTIFGEHAASVTPWLCLAVVGFAGHSALMGSLAGRLHWKTSSRLIAVDSGLRVALAGVVVVLLASVAGYAAATALTTLAWLIFLCFSSRARGAMRLRADVPLRAFLSRVGLSCLAAASSAALVVGFPVLLRLTSSEAVYSNSAPLILAIALTRAPLMIPITAYQGVAITHFMRHRARGIRALLPIAGVVVVAGAAGSLIAGLIGPWLLQVLAGPSYDIAGRVFAGLTLGATSLALLSLTGVLCQALDKHRASSMGWLLSLSTALVLLSLPFSIETRTVTSLAASPVLGIVIHLVAIRGSSQDTPSVTDTAS